MSKKKFLSVFLSFICLSLIFMLSFGVKSHATVAANEHQKHQQNQKRKAKKVTWKKQEQPVQIPILMYHAIHEMAPEESANANLIVAPKLFEEHIKTLSDNGYYFLSPEEAYKALTKNKLPQKKVVWVTFDDGNADFYSQAYPILKKYKAKATNNIITGFVQNQSSGNLTIQQMMEMSKYAMSFQGHTISHPDLSMAASDSQLSELADSKAFLDKALKQKTMTIAYPSGRYSQETIDLSKQVGYQLGLTTNEGLASAADGLLSLNRIRILPTTTPDLLLEQVTVD